MLNSQVQGNEMDGIGAGAVEENREGDRQRNGKRKDWSLATATRSRIDLDGPDFLDEGAVGSSPSVGLTTGGQGGMGLHTPDAGMRRAMEDESNRLFAAHYRAWEQSVVEEAMGCVPDPPGVQVVI